MGSKIEWTDETWNPVTGCTKVSDGCKFCYAERLFPKVYPGRAFTDIQIHRDRMEKPLGWRKPRMIFVNSMSDLFHGELSDQFIDDVFAVMLISPWHTYQVLTKRPTRMQHYMAAKDREEKWKEAIVRLAQLSGGVRDISIADQIGEIVPAPNVWLGTSIEDQGSANVRMQSLLDTCAAVRFVSAEPLIGSIDIMPWLASGLPVLNWVIVGGESGPKARPMHPDAARDLRDQCLRTGTRFFFKQWGEWCPAGHKGIPPSYSTRARKKEVAIMNPDTGKARDAVEMIRVGKKIAGRELDGREWNQMPGDDS